MTMTATTSAVPSGAAPLPDELGGVLVAEGFAPNACLLDINNGLAVPHDFELPAPWNLPSRLFRFPIETHRPDGEYPRTIGLRHPLLADHPFVQHVEKVLGMTIPRKAACNRYGYSSADTARWWHAVDLVTAGMWRELIDTARFTDPASMFRAVAFGLAYSSHRKERSHDGYLIGREGRTIMDALGATEPEDRAATIRLMAEPCPCTSADRRERWPVNPGHGCAEDSAWAHIFGIEDGWMEYDRAGFLQWSALGRSRWEAGDSATFVEASGQGGFAF